MIKTATKFRGLFEYTYAGGVGMATKADMLDEIKHALLESAHFEDKRVFDTGIRRR
jgi:ABC-type sulfate transport system substrate-binding protein